MEGVPALLLRTVSRLAFDNRIARIIPLYDSKPVCGRIEMDPTELRMVTEFGVLRMCFGDAETVLFQSNDAKMGLEFDFSHRDAWPYGWTYGIESHYRGTSYRLIRSFANQCRFIWRQEGGTQREIQDWDGFSPKESRLRIESGEATGYFSASLQFIRTEWNHQLFSVSYAEALARQRAAFQAFLDAFPTGREPNVEAHELAVYTVWSGCVAPYNGLKREAVLMSKNWMTQVWSWDHCFNAIAFAGAHSQLAWDQWMVLFDFQDTTGLLPDSVSDQGSSWVFCKPPIHGWALRKVMERMELTPRQLSEAYKKLSRWTRWWLTYRDSDGNGIYEYHHGNDSGWDNSTAFQSEVPIEMPELQAFLVVQMEVLSDLAHRLGKEKAAVRWAMESEALLTRMVSLCFTQGGDPIVREVVSQKTWQPTTLLLYLPILLGKRLPETIRNRLVEVLKSEQFLTPWGLATEGVNSTFYESDGYWRGPIWAPVMLLMTDGLESCGETDFAKELRKRYLRLFCQGGSAENFDALTGKGNRDTGYSWASAVYLVMESLETEQ